MHLKPAGYANVAGRFACAICRVKTNAKITAHIDMDFADDAVHCASPEHVRGLVRAQRSSGFHDDGYVLSWVPKTSKDVRHSYTAPRALFSHFTPPIW
jgi:hypothetical protein